MSKETLATHPLASPLVRETPGEFVARHIPQYEPGEYQTFLAQKVTAARQAMLAGDGSSNEEVDAAFAARRAQVFNK